MSTSQKAIECFSDNLDNYIGPAQAEPYKHNLNAGLLNMAMAIKNLEMELARIKQVLANK